MSKEDMLKARAFIKQQKYDEARAVLHATTHSKAPSWLGVFAQSPEKVYFKLITRGRGAKIEI